MELGRLAGVAFTAMMAAYFIFSFLLPQQTDFWLVKNGFPILMIEGFFGIFFTLLIAQAQGKETGWTITGNANPKLALLAVFIFAAVFVAALNPSLLWYLALSVGVKYSRSSRLPDMKFEGNEAVFSAAFLVLGVFAALLLAPLLSLFFPAQNADYTAHFRATGASGEIVDNPMVLVLWGFFYYAGMALFGLKMPAPNQNR